MDQGHARDTGARKGHRSCGAAQYDVEIACDCGRSAELAALAQTPAVGHATGGKRAGKIALGPGTGGPMYDTIKLMLPSQVSNTMWDMIIPQGFHMGTLPPRP